MSSSAAMETAIMSSEVLYALLSPLKTLWIYVLYLFVLHGFVFSQLYSFIRSVLALHK